MNIVVRTIICNLLVNIFLVVVKILCGIIFNSKALIADGVHSLSDLITDFISLFGEEIAKSRKGKKKIIFEDKTSFLIGIVVVVLAIFMIVKSFDSKESVPSAIVIYISIFGIIVKTIIVKYMAKMGKKFKNPILVSSAEESGADIITSIIALIAIVLSQLSDRMEIFKYSDILGGITIGVIMFFIGVHIIVKNEKDIKRIKSINK